MAYQITRLNSKVSRWDRQQTKMQQIMNENDNKVKQMLKKNKDTGQRLEKFQMAQKSMAAEKIKKNMERWQTRVDEIH